MTPACMHVPVGEAKREARVEQGPGALDSQVHGAPVVEVLSHNLGRLVHEAAQGHHQHDHPPVQRTTHSAPNNALVREHVAEDAAASRRRNVAGGQHQGCLERGLSDSAFLSGSAALGSFSKVNGTFSNVAGFKMF